MTFSLDLQRGDRGEASGYFLWNYSRFIDVQSKLFFHPPLIDYRESLNSRVDGYTREASHRTLTLCALVHVYM